MKFRKFFATLFAPPKQRVRTPPADPLVQMHDDAMSMYIDALDGKPTSRRETISRRKWSQPQWANARSLLICAGIMDTQGRLHVQDYSAAAMLVRDAIAEEARKRKHKNYVPPR